VTYDPAFAFELAVIIRDGIHRMHTEQEDLFYYLTVMNENYAMPPMPERGDVKDGILKGMYKFRPSDRSNGKYHAQLFGSGAILNEVLQAQEMLDERYNVAADVWSVTSYKELHRDGLDVERWNMLNPTEEPKIPYVSQCLAEAPGVLVATSDYVRALPDSISRWCPRPMFSLGTDGFGRSDSRRALRDFFEIDARYIALATLAALAREGEIAFDDVEEAVHDLGINPAKANPMTS
jgi:pyruvate dehydrogenase E1 component